MHLNKAVELCVDGWLQTTSSCHEMRAPIARIENDRAFVVLILKWTAQRVGPREWEYLCGPGEAVFDTEFDQMNFNQYTRCLVVHRRYSGNNMCLWPPHTLAPIRPQVAPDSIEVIVTECEQVLLGRVRKGVLQDRLSYLCNIVRDHSDRASVGQYYLNLLAAAQYELHYKGTDNVVPFIPTASR